MAIPFQVMLITDEAPGLLARLSRALARPLPVATAVQLRLKRAPVAEFRSIAAELRDLTRARGVALLINGNVPVAREVAADGVHLPADGASIEATRALLPSRALVGVSCHSQHDVDATRRAGADYALLSPIHEVEGKAPPIGIQGFAAIARRNTLPLLALGGLSAADVSALRAAGASGIAVMRSIMAAREPADAMASLCESWLQGSPAHLKRCR